jgi:hypothetical protein
MPKDFIDLKYEEAYPIRGKVGIGYVYAPVIQSENKECMILYSGWPVWHIPPTEGYARNHIAGELQAALGLVNARGLPRRDTTLVLDDYVTVFSGDDARKMFNADSVFIYDLPLEEPFREVYAYRTGLLVYRKGRAIMLFKCFFTEEGKKREKEYIQRLHKKVRYKNGKWIYDGKKRDRLWRNL